jgi:hypothetical protein
MGIRTTGIDTFKATQLNTDSFNLNDINLLQVALKDKIYLRNRLIQERQEQGEFAIPVLQIQSLASIVGLYIVPPLWHLKLKG